MRPDREQRPGGESEALCTSLAGDSHSLARDSDNDRPRRQLEVEFVNRSCALIRGARSRELIVSLTRRAPVWATRDRAWVVQPHTARDVIAAAEARHIEVIITEQIAMSTKEQMVVPGGAGGERPDPGQGLW